MHYGLSRANGQPVFAPADSAVWDKELLAAARDFAADRETDRMFRVCDTPTGRADSKPAPAPSFAGEWSGIAVLRPDWSRSSPRLTVAHEGSRVQVELSTGDDCLFSGAWDLELCVDGQPLKTLSDWEQICWETDADVDYLELEIRLSQDVTVQRQILMARRDRLLFFADTILRPDRGHIAYRSRLPLDGHSDFQAEADTHDGAILVAGRRYARVLPLALAEWRSGFSRGNLQAVNGGLELTQSVDGQCLFAPLFLDLDRRRMKKEVTWRQLTIGQTRQIVPADTAVGYRAQAGKAQWLVYRSLGAPGIRTVLGQNLMHEFLFGSFSHDGQVETLLEIE